MLLSAFLLDCFLNEKTMSSVLQPGWKPHSDLGKDSLETELIRQWRIN